MLSFDSVFVLWWKIWVIHAGPGTGSDDMPSSGTRSRRSEIHSRVASGQSPGVRAKTPGPSDERSGIHSRGASGGVWGGAAQHPPSSLRPEQPVAEIAEAREDVLARVELAVHG